MIWSKARSSAVSEKLSKDSADRYLYDDVAWPIPNGQPVHQVSQLFMTIPVRKDLPVDAVYALDENGKTGWEIWCNS